MQLNRFFLLSRDDPDVKKFRQNHAAKVIQRGWREFHQTNKVRSSRKESPSQDVSERKIFNENRHWNFDRMP